MSIKLSPALIQRSAPSHVAAANCEKPSNSLIQKLRNVGNSLTSFFSRSNAANRGEHFSLGPRRSYSFQVFSNAFNSAKTLVGNAYEAISVKFGGASKPLYEGAPSAAERKAQGIAHAPQLHSTPETRLAAYVETVIREVAIPNRDACYQAGDKVGAKLMDESIEARLIERDRLLLPNAGANRAAPLYAGAPSAELKMAQATTRAPLVCFSQASKDVASLDKQINALIPKRDAAYTAVNTARAMYLDMRIQSLHLQREVLASDM